MKNLRHVWYIALNDVRGFMTDRLAFGMFIIFPFLFIIMFSLMLGNSGSSSDNRIELHLATQETSGVSVSLIQSLVTTDQTKLAAGSPVIIWEKDYNQAKANVDAGKLDGFILFPADFTQKVMSGSPSSIEVIAQAGATNTKAALDGLAGSIAAELSSESIEIKAVAQLLQQAGKSQSEIQQAVAAMVQNDQGVQQSVLTYASQSVGPVKQITASSYIVPGYLVMFVFFASAMASIGIIQSRQNYTLERLLANSVRKESVIGGYFLGGIFRGLIQIIIFWVVGILIFHVDIGASPEQL